MRLKKKKKKKKKNNAKLRTISKNNHIPKSNKKREETLMIFQIKKKIKRKLNKETYSSISESKPKSRVQ